MQVRPSEVNTKMWFFPYPRPRLFFFKHLSVVETIHLPETPAFQHALRDPCFLAVVHAPIKHKLVRACLTVLAEVCH